MGERDAKGLALRLGRSLDRGARRRTRLRGSRWASPSTISRTSGRAPLRGECSRAGRRRRVRGLSLLCKGAHGGSSCEGIGVDNRRRGKRIPCALVASPTMSRARSKKKKRRFKGTACRIRFFGHGFCEHPQSGALGNGARTEGRRRELRAAAAGGGGGRGRGRRGGGGGGEAGQRLSRR